MCGHFCFSQSLSNCTPLVLNGADLDFLAVCSAFVLDSLNAFCFSYMLWHLDLVMGCSCVDCVPLPQPSDLILSAELLTSFSIRSEDAVHDMLLS